MQKPLQGGYAESRHDDTPSSKNKASDFRNSSEKIRRTFLTFNLLGNFWHSRNQGYVARGSRVYSLLLDAEVNGVVGRSRDNGLRKI